MSDAQPSIKKGKSFSSIWIIPVVAMVLGIWMVVYTFMTEGPTIEIYFQTASGLEAGKTKIKYRSVQVGVVLEVTLSEDQEQVVAKVQLDRAMTDLLRDDTRFWVVTARIGAGSISGLDTLLSGAYIELSPGEGKAGTRSYVSLERPPLTPLGAPGVKLELLSEQAGSVSVGDSVLFQGYKVGRVESMDFDSSLKKIRYSIFIDAPFHSLVNSSTRFWNVSGISLSASADGISVSTGSLDTVILGGVAFGVPEGKQPGAKVENGAEFRLYESQEATERNPFEYGANFVVRFKQSLRGLKPGAPVEYRGIPIGRVERIMLKELTANAIEGGGAAIPVLIYVEPGRMELGDTPEALAALKGSITKGVPNGMRATLATGNLLTGALYIVIDFHEDAEVAEIGEYVGYPTIPTTGGGFARIERQLSAVLEKITALPLEGAVDSATKTLDELTVTLASLQGILDEDATKTLPAEMNAALADLRRTIQGLSPDSPLYQSLDASMYELNRTLENLRALTKTLSEQPNAAVLPVELPADPIPEARSR